MDSMHLKSINNVQKYEWVAGQWFYIHILLGTQDFVEVGGRLIYISAGLSGVWGTNTREFNQLCN